MKTLTLSMPSGATSQQMLEADCRYHCAGLLAISRSYGEEFEPTAEDTKVAATLIIEVTYDRNYNPSHELEFKVTGDDDTIDELEAVTDCM